MSDENNLTLTLGAAASEERMMIDESNLTLTHGATATPTQRAVARRAVLDRCNLRPRQYAANDDATARVA